MSLQDSKKIENVKVMLKTGMDGVGIKSIAKTSTSGLEDTYTITFDNDQTYTYTVTNGSSIASIEKTGSSGAVDTYTITLTNGNTSTFQVTNGEPDTYPASRVTYNNTESGMTADDVQEALDEVASDLKASDGLFFKFSKSGSQYGYKNSNNEFVPFKNPIGTKSITANGTYDVTDYASAEVNVPSVGPSGTKIINSNGDHNVEQYAIARVLVPNTNTETYTPTSRSQLIDMGASNNYRYLDTRRVPNENLETIQPQVNNSRIDMGLTNNVRFIDTTVVYALGQQNGEAYQMADRVSVSGQTSITIFGKGVYFLFRTGDVYTKGYSSGISELMSPNLGGNVYLTVFRCSEDTQNSIVIDRLTSGTYSLIKVAD